MEELQAGLAFVAERLADENLEPDPERTDWDEHRDAVRELREKFRDGVLRPFDQLRRELSGAEDISQIRAVVAAVGAPTVAVVAASGQSEDAGRLLAALCDVKADEWQAEFEAGKRDLDAFVSLMHGRWLVRNDELATARTTLGKVRDNSKEPALVKEARELLIRTKRLTRAPALFRLNGFGVGMYGSRDHIGESYVSTHCISALWIPIMPLSAYRVVDNGDDSYGFLAHEPLSAFATWYRRIAIVALLGWIVMCQVQDYLNDPERLAKKAYERAVAAEKAGQTDTAIQRYEAVIGDYTGRFNDGPVARSGEALARLYMDQLESPLPVSRADQAVAAIQRFAQLPHAARTHAAQSALVERALAISRQMAPDEPDARSKRAAIPARLRVLNAAIEGNDRRANGSAVTERAGLLLQLGGLLEADWPLDALTVYVEDLGGSDSAEEGALRVLASIKEHFALLHTAAPIVQPWLDSGGGGADARAVGMRLQAIATSMSDPKRAEAVQAAISGTGNIKPLTAWLKANPWDQDAAAYAASFRASSGDIKGAIEMLSALGKPGWLTPLAHRTLLALVGEDGQLNRAEAMLEDKLEFVLPRMLAAASAYFSAAEQRQTEFINMARYGGLPEPINSKLVVADPADAQRMFGEWMAEQLQNDAQLTGLRTTFERYADASEYTVTLGTYKLRRANQSQGEERARLLDEAERVFLSISQAAEGLPEYHLGLGQVYHRLGKAEDGEAQFARLLAMGPEQQMQVVYAYRELGMVARAREVAESVYETRQAPFHQAAAEMLSIMSHDDLDMAVTWLERADQESPGVRIRLRSLSARKHARDGDMSEADKLTAEVAAYYEGQAAHNSTAANNAAVAYMERYQYTCKKSHLLAAKKNLEASLRLQPDNTITLQNNASTLSLLGMHEVLGPWIKTDLLCLDDSQARTLLSGLQQGAKAPQVLAGIRRNPNLRRALELVQQRTVLAPKAVGGYSHAAYWYNASRDADKLRALGEQIASRLPLDTADADVQRARMHAGERDEELVASADQTLAQLKGYKKRIKRHKPTLAAWNLSIGDVHLERARATGQLSDVQAAEQSYRAADAAWPDIGAKYDLAGTLLHIAVLKASATEPALAAAYDKDRRIYRVAELVYRATTGPDGAAILAALRKQPELTEAVRLHRAVVKNQPTVPSWIIATAAGDAKLEEQARAAFSDERLWQVAQVYRLLLPGDPDTQYRHEMFSKQRQALGIASQ